VIQEFELLSKICDRRDSEDSCSLKKNERVYPPPLITGKIVLVQPQRRQCQKIFFGRWAFGLKSLEPVDFTFVGKVPRVLDPL
jgi:hypothetical protein